MREILFRGKRTDNGEWVQGYPCRYGWIGKEKDYIIPDYASALYTAEVDPETIGQYTGLTDMNGNKIFKKDIIHIGRYTGIVKWDNDSARFALYQKDMISMISGFNADTMNMALVIGNIHDNPELLKGGI